jgi:AraC family transcriptional regulator of adaptative response/methylated-DNA-[protein]-cysteine methyltransferase
MARLSRLRRGFESLADGGKVIDAQCSAGFESASAFREAFARLLGCTPAELTGGGKLMASWIDTPMGAMIAVADKRALHLLEFIERKALATELKKLSQLYNADLGIGRYPPIEQAEQELRQYFAGERAAFTVPLAYHASPFTCQVWDALRQIPAGQTRSYSELAQAVGKPAAIRAVARANGANPIAVMVPCHRVLGADGSLTGYGGGLWRKQRLIELERLYGAGQ